MQEKAIAEREATLLKEQDLQNCLRGRDYGSAIALALELKRPLRLWSVFRDAMTEGLGDHPSGPGTSGDDGEGLNVVGRRADPDMNRRLSVEGSYRHKSLPP